MIRGRGRRRAAAIGVALVGLGAGLLPARADIGPVGLPHTYPDLVPHVSAVYVDRPYLGVDPVTGENRFGPPRVSFDTVMMNLGTVSLDLLTDASTSTSVSPVSQCVAWVLEACAERRNVGEVAWHEAHRHFHFQDFARYELRRLRPDGRVDHRPRGLLALSDKVSFCLMDTTPVRDGARPVPTYTLVCAPHRQGISAGWGDVYAQGLPGQQLSVEGLADGRYALVTTADPTDRLFESDNGNNREELVIELSNGLTQAAVVGPARR